VKKDYQIFLEEKGAIENFIQNLRGQSNPTKKIMKLQQWGSAPLKKMLPFKKY
jgi:hypothetical protein